MLSVTRPYFGEATVSIQAKPGHPKEQQRLEALAACLGPSGELYDVVCSLSDTVTITLIGQGASNNKIHDPFDLVRLTMQKPGSNEVVYDSGAVVSPAFLTDDKQLGPDHSIEQWKILIKDYFDFIREQFLGPDKQFLRTDE